MKLPALLIAVFVAAGVLAAAPIAAHVAYSLDVSLGIAVCCILAGFWLLKLSRVELVWSAGLLAWFFLAAAAAQIERLAVPPNEVPNLAGLGQLDLNVPLRWQGILREDPLRLPWGLRYDIDLEQVQTAGEWRAVHGGLRTTYFFDARVPGNPEPVRAGERVEILARARLVRNFGDPGAFDYRGALRQQGIDLTATLRNPALMQALPGPAPGPSYYLARLRGRLLNELDAMLSPADDRAAIARAMLLGDRSFLDSQQAESFRDTGAFHVLVLAGLHVGVLAALFLWTEKKLRLPIAATAMLTIAALCFYMAIIEDRPPITRAALMAIIYLLARIFYRRVALLNAVSLAAIAILLFRPSEVAQASFQLSFLAAGIIAAIAGPLLERTAEPYRRALEHLGDVTRDGSYSPKATELRLDLRSLSARLGSMLPSKLAGHFRSDRRFTVSRCSAAVGIGRALDRSADRNASADGPGSSPRLFYSASCKHSRRAAYRRYRAVWVRIARSQRGVERTRTCLRARAGFFDWDSCGIDPLVCTTSLLVHARSFAAHGSTDWFSPGCGNRCGGNSDLRPMDLCGRARRGPRVSRLDGHLSLLRSISAWTPRSDSPGRGAGRLNFCGFP